MKLIIGFFVGVVATVGGAILFLLWYIHPEPPPAEEEFWLGGTD